MEDDSDDKKTALKRFLGFVALLVGAVVFTWLDEKSPLWALRGICPIAGGLFLWLVIYSLNKGSVFGGSNYAPRWLDRDEYPRTFWFYIILYLAVSLNFFALAIYSFSHAEVMK